MHKGNEISFYAYFYKEVFFVGKGNKELTYVPCLRYDYPDLQLIF